MDLFTPALAADRRTGLLERATDPPVWTVVLAGICAFLNLYATQPILPLLAHVFHVDKAEISLTMLASTLGVAVAAPFMGRLADRLGRRRIIVVSASLLGITSLLAATSVTLPQLIFWRFLQGVFTPGVFAVTVAYINDGWQASKVGSAMAAYVSGTVIGGFCGRVACGFIADHGDWRVAFLSIGRGRPAHDSGHLAQHANRDRSNADRTSDAAACGHAGTLAQRGVAGALCRWVLRVVFAGRRVYVCDVPPGRAAV